MKLIIGIALLIAGTVGVVAAIVMPTKVFFGSRKGLSMTGGIIAYLLVAFIGFITFAFGVAGTETADNSTDYTEEVDADTDYTRKYPEDDYDDEDSLFDDESSDIAQYTDWSIDANNALTNVNTAFGKTVEYRKDDHEGDEEWEPDLDSILNVLQDEIDEGLSVESPIDKTDKATDKLHETLNAFDDFADELRKGNERKAHEKAKKAYDLYDKFNDMDDEIEQEIYDEIDEEDSE